ncbi:MAG: hypothetical protein F4117_12525 [Acidimicrobiales bacterium]|nr:hypothetical protein [Acidimicrobiaceae bacterium]MXV86579.1 hypothetical protein [Acidimicrobiales bacterium]MXX43806.1 hypothetical protein [Acidimicrobiales bacterium]MXY02201.1 hypothetical protein [Acidimicrobiales bacterium]MYB81567.1 hypothetical protein [Acidimicrobiales bacterium]
MAGLSEAGDHWRWLSMREVLDAWEQAPIDVEATDLFRLLTDVSGSPLDQLPGDPFPPSQPGSPVRTKTAYGIEIAFVVVHPVETHGLRLVNIRSA